MARVKYQIQEEHLFEIKSLVEYTFGKKVLNATDSFDLAKHIFEKVKTSVSPDTLRRLFGLIETNSKPSLFTLDVLTKYVGFQGYYDFVNSIALVGKHNLNKQILDCISDEKMPFQTLETLQKAQPSIDYYNILQQLILLAHQKNDKLFFEKLFINQLGFEWITFFKYEIYQTIQLLGKLVEKNEWLQEIALKNYVGLPFFFDYFVEWYVSDDQAYYFKLLEEYNKFHDNNSEKQIFFHSIMGLQAYKNKRFKNFEHHFQTILERKKNSIPNNVLLSRILGIKFLNDLRKDKVVAENNLLKIDFYALFPDIGDRVTSIFFLFNYLFESKSFSLMTQLAEKWVSNETIFFSIWTRINWNQLCVYLTYAYLHLNNKEFAENYYKQINTSLFEVYNRSRFQLLYDKINLM